MTRNANGRRFAWLLAALALGGCGLKGSLTLPSQSDEVVIRGAGQAAPASSDTANSPAGSAPSDSTTVPAAGAAPSDAAVQPAVTRPARGIDRIPPPPLPGGNSGSAGSG